MTSLLQHAKAELRSSGAFDPATDEDVEIGPATMALVEVFHAYTEHASWAERKNILDAFNLLVDHKPLTPLTGEDDEWATPEGSSGQIISNKRCTRVFKDDEMAWDVEEGRKPITFPYMPE